MALLANVVVEKTTYAFDSPFSYYVPSALEESLKPGCRVMVPFGAANRKRQGLVLSVEEETVIPEKPLKEVAAQMDAEPILNEEQLWLMKLLHERVFCTWYDAMKVLIPSGLGLKINILCSLNPRWEDPMQPDRPEEIDRILTYLRGKKKPVALALLQDELELNQNNRAMAWLIEQEALLLTEDVRQKTQDVTVQMIRLAEQYESGEEEPQGMTAKQKTVYRLLMDCGCASMKEAAYFCGVTTAVIKNMVKHGIVEEFGKPVLRNPYEEADFEPEKKKITLTTDQQKACDELQRLMTETPGATALLHGVTGSGKTQVFLQLIQDVLDQGKQVIVMVPEISLTPQTVEVFQRRFGRRVAVMHSGLTMGERADEYKRIRNGDADVVIGTRSSVFAPLDNLGLIVMDEEQEKCYQSELSPKFHARDVAKWRCAYHKAMLLLSSATPSVESFFQAKSGKYHLLTLKERYHGGSLPDVNIVDMSDQYGAIFSQQLIMEIQSNLKKKEQTILLMNRRGYHTIVKCSQCGEVATCPNCSVALTYHSVNGKLMCHYCGHTQSLNDECTACGSKMIRYGGAGTQKVEEELTQLFPHARVLRMDMDTTMSRDSHEKKFAAFARGDYDIMVGTQMVAKGLNFPNVTLVGVLNADQSLFAQDFRCYENTFSLLTQVIGRCGRGELPGRAYIQTTDPDHYILEQAARQDYEGFYADEIVGRKVGLYPPFCSLCRVGFVSQNPKMVQVAAKRFGADFARRAKEQFSQLPLRVLEPCMPSMEKIAGKYRYQLVIKCRQDKSFSELMWQTLKHFDSDKQNKEVHVSVDMNYNGSM